MKRHNHRLVSRRGQKYELDRQKWTTYSNFNDMYRHIIDEMVSAGVAKELDEPVWMDREGNVVGKSNSLGCKVTHQITRPDMCICGDEVGGNISMTGDGHVSGEKKISPRGKVARTRASSKSRKFTMIGLTAFTSEPVMCCLIIEGKQSNHSIEAGMDIDVHLN